MQGFLGLSDRAVWSSQAMVTPQISGLANGAALGGMFAAGIQAVMGDNT